MHETLKMKKEELKILILIGIPASDKSKWAADYVRNNPNWVRVNRDDFRAMLKNAQVCENKIEDMITALVIDTIDRALMKNLSVLIDNTNLKRKYIDEFIERFKYQADIDYRVFDVSLAKAIERDAARERKVGAGVIKNMYESYKILIDSFDFQPVKKIKSRPIIKPNFDSHLPQAVVFDIDGTLAHIGNRSVYDWAKVYVDDINHIVAEQMEYHRSKGRKIIVLTGRDAVCRKETEEWFELYGMKFDVMYMRPEGSSQKDTVVKRNIYEQEIKNQYNLLCVYDDRLSVVRMWADLNVFVFNCNQGLIEF